MDTSNNKHNQLLGDSAPCATGNGNTDTVETNVKQLGAVHHGLSTQTNHKMEDINKSQDIVFVTEMTSSHKQNYPNRKPHATDIHQLKVRTNQKPKKPIVNKSQQTTQNKPSYLKRNAKPNLKSKHSQQTKNKLKQQVKHLRLKTL